MSVLPAETETDRRSGVARARYALAAVFCVHGAVTGNFASRVPWIQDHASVDAGQLGVALAFPAIGASVAMTAAGAIQHRLGGRAAMRALLPLWTLALVPIAFSPDVYALCATLFLYGATAGMSDVVMNAIGVETENRMGRSIMTSLHGMWSAGLLVGSGAGTIAAHADLDARVQFAAASAVLTVLGLVISGWVLDTRAGPDERPPPHFALPPRSAWLIGAVGFCAVFAEGASLDWSAVYLEDVLDASPGLAAASTTGFALTMAVARLVGDRVVDRFGGVGTVRAGGVVATVGGVMIVTAPHAALAMTGFALLGLGVAAVVPLAFAAAGRSGPNASQAIAGVATVTYTSALIAPAVIGAVAGATSLVVSFCVVATLTLGVTAGAGVLRTSAPPSTSDSRQAAPESDRPRAAG